MSIYNKKLITRISENRETVEFIENCLASEDDAAKYYFHKIMVHNWVYDDIQLYEILNEYFGVTFIPINFSTQNFVTTFYTCSLPLVMKIINLDFVIVYNRNMYNIDVLFNDKTSLELFGNKLSIEDVVGGVISNRFNEYYELDLSDFCNDREFIKKRIHFYKLSLLSYFKLLMLRMGRETKILNLSNNKLSEVPQEIMNFFIKGDLLGVNLSNNYISSITSLHRMNSKIEKLWIEGNPLCEDLTESGYIKEVMKKFPRLVKLDGIRINNHGIIMPFHKNFMLNDDDETKCMVEEFVTRYFAHYDSQNGRNVRMFYDLKVQFTISSNFNDIEKESMPRIATFSRNFHKPNIQEHGRIYKTKDAAVAVLDSLPRGRHDLTSFKIDVIYHNGNITIFVIDGLFKEMSERCFNFRRTFLMKCKPAMDCRKYLIKNEMFTISLATKELKNSFQCPTRHIGELRLINPTTEEQEVMIKLFTHLTQLKRTEAEFRMKKHSWDIRQCLTEFHSELRHKRIDKDLFMADDEINYLSDNNMMDEID